MFRAKGWNESSEKRKRIEQIERTEAEDNWNCTGKGMERKKTRERGKKEEKEEKQKKG